MARPPGRTSRARRKTCRGLPVRFSSLSVSGIAGFLASALAAPVPSGPLFESCFAQYKKTRPCPNGHGLVFYIAGTGLALHGPSSWTDQSGTPEILSRTSCPLFLPFGQRNRWVPRIGSCRSGTQRASFRVLLRTVYKKQGHALMDMALFFI